MHFIGPLKPISLTGNTAPQGLSEPRGQSCPISLTACSVLCPPPGSTRRGIVGIQVRTAAVPSPSREASAAGRPLGAAGCSLLSAAAPHRGPRGPVSQVSPWSRQCRAVTRVPSTELEAGSGWHSEPGPPQCGCFYTPAGSLRSGAGRVRSGPCPAEETRGTSLPEPSSNSGPIRCSGCRSWKPSLLSAERHPEE